MTSRLRDVVRMESILLIVLALSLVIPLILAVAYGEESSQLGFAITFAIAGLLGLAGKSFIKPSDKKLRFRDGFLVVSLAWILSSLFGALPFIISGAIPYFPDAFFETASGFTTTGASILTEIESLPKSILFWRSFTHWLGGMGIIVIVMALLPMFGISGQIAANAETPGPTKDKVTAKFSDTARGLYTIYACFTLAETALLMVGGMNLYDALVHSFATMGTGGFSTYNNSIAHFSSPYIQIVIIIFMLIAGVNFNLYFLAKRRGIKSIFKDEEARFYLLVIGIASALVFLANALTVGSQNIGRTLLNGVFQVVSITTTTGFVTDNYDLWPIFSRMVIMTLFFIGGCSSSTGGGVKCVRVLLLFKLIKRNISMKIHPNRIYKITLNEVEVTTEVLNKIVGFICLFIAALMGGSLLVSVDNFDFMTTFSAVATCIGNIGPGFNDVGPVYNFSIFSGFAKIVLSFLMVAGRLELYTIFVLFSRNYWMPNRSR